MVRGFHLQVCNNTAPMDIPPTKSRRLSPVFLPEEIIAEILSFLNVKTLTRLRCVSKSWNALISDPTFVKTHLKKSARNPNLALTWKLYKRCEISGFIVVPFPVRRLLENPSIKIAAKTGHRLQVSCNLVGSCNRLLCLVFYSLSRTRTAVYRKIWFCFWNPAMRTRSEKLGVFRYSINHMLGDLLGDFKFTFCCDDSTRIYKVVKFRVESDKENKDSWKSEVEVFSLGDNCWRKIQSFPVVPLNWLDIGWVRLNDGVHLSGTFNWLALRNNFRCVYDYMTINNVEQFVIVSLDLSTETYTQLLLPRGFDAVPVPQIQPTLRVLMDCLCFSYDFKRTEFVVWQMREYGVQESWTQLLRISYQNLPMFNWDYFDFGFQLLCLSENGDVMILANERDHQAFIYNRRENRVERTRISNDIDWFSSMDYVESLVSTH